MTESDAIARFKSCQENVGNCEKCRFYSCCGIYDMEDLAIEALKEVQEYRKIGTPEELKAASKYLRLVKKHGTVGKTIEECAEYEGIGTVEECRAAMKKKPEKPMEEWGVFGEPEEKDIGRLEALHHKILYSKLAEIVTEQEMIALLRAKDALKKQLSEPDIERGW
jgi:hypothetical protein